MPAVVEVTGSQAVRNGGFRRFAWCVLIYNVLVVLWGGYVRASGSGAGCGSHWPLCNGVMVPAAPKIETIIEFTHRLTSGLAVAAAVVLCVWGFRVFPRGHRGRKTASLAVVFLLMEALLGAGLVLFRYVAQDASAGRAWYLSAHLVNTQLLLGMLAATAWLAGPDRPAGAPLLNRFALPAALAAAITGALAALGDTLFPAASLAAGMAREFSEAAPMLLRLRLLHPVAAVAAAVFLIVCALRAGSSRYARWVLILVFAQVGFGILNWILLAPIWMQIGHLLLADLLWISLVLLYLEHRVAA
jgi:cytochrome c oxidase assembly protein subunit 15